MATFFAHIKIFDGKEAAFEKVARELWKQTHTLEKDVLRYEYFRSEKPGHYYCLLSFKDFNSFMVHQTSDHHEAPDFGALLESNRLEWLDPVDGANELPATNPQKLPPNASELHKRYSQDHGVVMQDWWLKLRGCG